MMVRFEGVCAHCPLRDGVFRGVRVVGVVGLANALGCPLVDTILIDRLDIPYSKINQSK